MTENFDKSAISDLNVNTVEADSENIINIEVSSMTESVDEEKYKRLEAEVSVLKHKLMELENKYDFLISRFNNLYPSSPPLFTDESPSKTPPALPPPVIYTPSLPSAPPPVTPTLSSTPVPVTSTSSSPVSNPLAPVQLNLFN